ncbi:MAG: argininosuccinate synthase, partial [Phycisphaerae bacterium]|nr:argininosuccinate synthase [Phycisphaerae bacterium]
ALRYAELVYYGQWYSPLREALDAFINKTQEHVTGSARIKLYKGNCRAVGVKSAKSLFVPALASFHMGAEYDSTDADGFIRLFALPLKVQSTVQAKRGRNLGKATPKKKAKRRK